jgi:WD40 repeat protein
MSETSFLSCVKVKEISGNIEQALMLDDRRALICTGKQLKILDLPSAIVTRDIHNGKGKRVLRPGLLNKEQVLAVSGGRRHLKIMSLTTGELVKTLQDDSVGGQIEHLLVSRNGSTAVAFKDCGVAVVWDISTHACKVCTTVDINLFNPRCIELETVTLW